MGHHFFEDYAFLSDEELVEKIREGDYFLMDLLTSRFMPVIAKIARRNVGRGFDYEDLVQEGRIAIYSAVQSFVPGKASFHTFSVLCITRGISTMVKGASAARRIPDRMVDSIGEADGSFMESPEKIVIDRENYEQLTDNIKVSLSALEYKVLCEFLSGIRYSEIAAHLGLSVKSVDNALSRIRSKLRR